MDERRGRIYASRLKIPVVRTLGILLEGKRRGLIAEVRPLLDALLQAGYHASTALYDKVLMLAGEN